MRGCIAALVLLLALSACVSGDVDEEKPTDTVPAGIGPEDATFRLVTRDDGAPPVFVVRLSSVPMCERAGVPADHPFVEIEIQATSEGQLSPGTCKLDQKLTCRIRLMRTTAPECASTTGTIASFGHVQIDEVADDVIRGSFVGENPHSKIDLRGSFVATRCAANTSC